MTFAFSEDPDVKRSIDEMLIAHGYPFEEHQVLTIDGYQLKIYRITGGKNSTGKDVSEKQPVLFGHGLADSSDLFVSNEEELSPGYIAANLGFDLWLMNSRGNKHSRSNIYLDPKSKQFWDYSFHEIGNIDVKAIIEYIKNHTKKEKIIYIGHSQGGSQIFALCSLNPNFCQNNIKGILALAPAVFLHHNRSPYLKELAILNIKFISDLLGIYNVFGSRESSNKFTTFTCKYFHLFCHMSAKFISEDDPTDNNENRDEVGFSHYPSGTSVKTLAHYQKLMLYKKFVDYNGNEYPLSAVNVPVHLFGGNHDRLVVELDLNILAEKIKKVLKKYIIFEYQGHSTFLMTCGTKNNYIEEYKKSLLEISSY